MSDMHLQLNVPNTTCMHARRSECVPISAERCELPHGNAEYPKAHMLTACMCSLTQSQPRPCH